MFPDTTTNNVSLSEAKTSAFSLMVSDVAARVTAAG